MASTMIYFLYLMKDPLGRPDIKFGITNHPGRRLGQYQNSYSSLSFVTQFNWLWVGQEDSIKNLELDVKRKFYDKITRTGLGFTEWISNIDIRDLQRDINQLVNDRHYKIMSVDESLLPIDVYNLNRALNWLESQPDLL